jgi:hypothetical protein
VRTSPVLFRGRALFTYPYALTAMLNDETTFTLKEHLVESDLITVEELNLFLEDLL